LETVTEYYLAAAQGDEASPIICRQGAREIRFEIFYFDIRSRHIRPFVSVTVPWIVPVVIWVCELTIGAIARITSKLIPSPLTRRAKEGNLIYAWFLLVANVGALSGSGCVDCSSSEILFSSSTGEIFFKAFES